MLDKNTKFLPLNIPSPVVKKTSIETNMQTMGGRNYPDNKKMR